MGIDEEVVLTVDPTPLKPALDEPVSQQVAAARTAIATVAAKIHAPTGTPAEYAMQIKDWAVQQTTKNPTLLGGFVMEMRRLGRVAATPAELEDLYVTFMSAT